MTPAPSRIYQKVTGDLFAFMHALLLNSSCEVYIAPFDVLLPDSETAEEYETVTVVQPDISVICDLNKLNDRACKGAPDLVVETLSPSTAARDLKVKHAPYEEHGVTEYWLGMWADWNN
jgi:Uma2 family endonuclease